MSASATRTRRVAPSSPVTANDPTGTSSAGPLTKYTVALRGDTTNDPGPWEGEPRNMWKPTQQEALWFHGGNLHQSRHYSQFLALQLKARMEAIPTPVYGLQEVHHAS